jgi:hypothetical protein
LNEREFLELPFLNRLRSMNPCVLYTGSSLSSPKGINPH